MKLYERIDNPRYFQRSVFMRRIVALANKFRMFHYGYFSFKSEKVNTRRMLWVIIGILGRFFLLLDNLLKF